MTAAILGYIGTIVASVFFGSNYVPVKKYPTGDGFAFVYVFSAGVMVVGFVAMFVNGADNVIFVPSGMLGGTIWTLGNLMVVPIVKLIGLGLGVLVWSGTSIVMGFAVGKFGLFGVLKDVIAHVAMNWTGIALILVSMGVFFFIKPELKNDQEEEQQQQHHHEEERGNIKHRSTSSKYEQVNTTEEEALLDGADRDHSGSLHTKPSKSIVDRIPPKFRTVLGFALSIISGCFYGLNMVPMKLWAQDKANPPPLAFVLSHFTGIYLFSTVVFLVYCLAKRPPQVFPQTMLPSFLSGAMWGIAQCGLMVATQILGFTIGVPIGSAGPGIVNAFWSVFVFREIRGAKNLVLLVFSMLLSIGGIALVSLSK